MKWHQVHAWRLAQHGLSPRLNSRDVVGAAARTAGIQAQVMSAAELALCTRVEGLSQQDVRSALWQERTLIKTWAMRGTLHVLAASDLPLYVAAQGFHDNRNWPEYFAYYGFTPAQQEAYLSAVPQVLRQEPMTRQQLAEALARQTGMAHVRDFILSSSWGTPLKASAFRGDLCCGPNQGQNATFVNPRAWLGAWQVIEPEQALQEIARRYLQAYGPATSEDFARWWGCGRSLAKKLFQSIADELEEVEVEGWQARALHTTLESMQRFEPLEAIHLLPLFDAYTIGVPRDLEPFLAQAYKSQIFRLQGWVSAVVLVNGSIQGVWNSTKRRSQIVVKVNLFCLPTASIRKGIEAEAERLSDFFKMNVALEYDDLIGIFDGPAEADHDDIYR